MRIRTVALAGIAGLSLALGVVAAACGGDGGGDSLTLEEYFQRLDELDNKLTEQTDALEPRLESLSEAEALEQLPEILTQQGALFEDFSDGLADLDPPAEAEDLHIEAVDALGDLVDANRDARDQAEGVDSFADLEEVFGEDLTAAEARITQVCLDAEQLAADNDITVDLDCEKYLGLPPATSVLGPDSRR
jgi:hypothetical protein